MADIEGPEEEALHMVAILRPVVDITSPEEDIMVDILTMEEVITEDILTVEEGMATMEGAILIIEGGIPTTGDGHITGDGIPIGGGIPTMEAGTPILGDMAPGMGHGIFRPGMFLLHRLSMLHRLLAFILIPRSNNHTLILTPHS